MSFVYIKSIKSLTFINFNIDIYISVKRLVSWIEDFFHKYFEVFSNNRYPSHFLEHVPRLNKDYIWVRLRCIRFKCTKARNLDKINNWTTLETQSCKLYNNKCMIPLTQITNFEIFTFIAVLVFKLLSPKVLFINRKDNRNC